MFILKMRVQLPDGTITKLPLVVHFKNQEPKVASFATFDEAIDWIVACLPGSPDIEEVEDLPK